MSRRLRHCRSDPEVVCAVLIKHTPHDCISLCQDTHILFAYTPIGRGGHKRAPLDKYNDLLTALQQLGDDTTIVSRQSLKEGLVRFDKFHNFKLNGTGHMQESWAVAEGQKLRTMLAHHMHVTKTKNKTTTKPHDVAPYSQTMWDTPELDALLDEQSDDAPLNVDSDEPVEDCTNGWFSNTLR